MTAPTRCIRCRERPALGLVCDPCLIAGRESGPRAISPPVPARAVERPHTAPAIRVTLPFAALVSDNRRQGGMLGWTSREYRAAKQAMRAESLIQLGRPPLLRGPVTLEARLWWPNRRERDPSNYAKGTHDAMQGVLYIRDSQIVRATWETAGLDRAHPRAEITVRAIEATYIGGTDNGREHG